MCIYATATVVIAAIDLPWQHFMHIGDENERFYMHTLCICCYPISEPCVFVPHPKLQYIIYLYGDSIIVLIMLIHFKYAVLFHKA